MWEHYYDEQRPAYRDEITTLLAEIGDALPASIDLGYHLCYGSPRDAHLVQPLLRLLEWATGMLLLDPSVYLIDELPARVEWVEVIGFPRLISRVPRTRRQVRVVGEAGAQSASRCRAGRPARVSRVFQHRISARVFRHSAAVQAASC